eukprot:1798830-Rhodomonas_salina.1
MPCEKLAFTSLQGGQQADNIHSAVLFKFRECHRDSSTVWTDWTIGVDHFFEYARTRGMSRTEREREGLAAVC